MSQWQVKILYGIIVTTILLFGLFTWEVLRSSYELSSREAVRGPQTKLEVKNVQ